MEKNKDEFSFEFYSEEEIKRLIKSKAELYYVDDGVDEAIIKFEDIPDFIVEYNRKFDVRDLKFFKVGKCSYEPDITTYGEYLNSINSELREKLIDRLVALQKNEIEPKKIRIIDEDFFKHIENKIDKEQEKRKENKKKNKEAR